MCAAHWSSRTLELTWFIPCHRNRPGVFCSASWAPVPAVFPVQGCATDRPRAEQEPLFVRQQLLPGGFQELLPWV